VAIGLFATLVAAWLSTDDAGGSSVKLEWEARAELPDSGSAAIPGGGSMRIEGVELRRTEANVNAEKVFRATAVLWIEAGSAVGQGRVRCRMSSSGDYELGRTVNSRGAYPRSSGEYNLTKQDVPGSVGIRFHSNGAEYASLPMDDTFGVFTDKPGVVVSWDTYNPRSQRWQWGLPEGRPSQPLELGFATFWRGTAVPEIEISCSVENATGSASVETGGGF
ncbi:MAG TPA: hypothetical protein VFC52_00750, partial [Solirubrobacterales bacterium]|nr:hypothetical protein [Solirubrobacterales bacterium]